MTTVRRRLAFALGSYAVFVLIRLLERQQSGLNAPLMSQSNLLTVGFAAILTALMPFRPKPTWILVRALQMAGFGYVASLFSRLIQGVPFDWPAEPVQMMARALPLSIAGLAGGAMEFAADKQEKQRHDRPSRPPTYW